MKSQTSYPGGSGRAPTPVVGRPEALARLAWLSEGTWRLASALFDVRIPRGWFERIEPTDPADPLALQALPAPEELQVHPEDRVDPVGDAAKSPDPWVVRKHPDRVLLLLTKRCHLYCRYCFRRNHRPTQATDPTPAELERALRYCETSGAREVILSGGDPLALGDARLLPLVRRLSRSMDVVRIHTRAPITWPERVSEALVETLSTSANLWVVVHANHPRELSPPVREALSRLVGAGIPVLNQSVLLRGVNDDVDTLVALCEALVGLRVKPYYLHHPDRVQGNAHFRLSLSDGLALHQALAARVSGVALPAYVVDLPDGSGKVGVTQALAEGRWGPMR